MLVYLKKFMDAFCQFLSYMLLASAGIYSILLIFVQIFQVRIKADFFLFSYMEWTTVLFLFLHLHDKLWNLYFLFILVC